MLYDKDLASLFESNILPENIRRIGKFCIQNNITESDINNIRRSRRSQSDIKNNKARYIDPELREAWKYISPLSESQLRLLPCYLIKNNLINPLLEGTIEPDDITMNFDTSAGRNAIAKKYVRLVQQIVNLYINKTRLSKSDLLSAGLDGLNNAINNYKQDHTSRASFKTYASNLIRYAILDEIKNNRDLSGSPVDKKALDAINLSQLTGNTDQEIALDKISALGVADQDKNYKEENKNWDKLYKALESKFSARDMDVFYRYFGLNGRPREKSKDIAKSYGMSEGNIRNSIINKILKYIHKTPEIKDIIDELRELYTECVLIDYYNTPSFIESLAQDDVYILLEEISKFNSSASATRCLKNAIDSNLLDDREQSFIKDLLYKDYAYADKNIKTKHDVILKFLSIIEPGNRYTTDIDILDKISELQKIVAKYKIVL